MGQPRLSKNHHFVPKAILREFCFSGESIYRLDKGRVPMEAKSKNIDRVFQRFHLNNYHLSDGQKDDRVERFFGKEFDNYLPNWISYFSNASVQKTEAFPDNASRMRFVYFFYYHTKRNPDFVDPIVEKVANGVFHADILAEVEERIGPISEESKEKLFDPKWREQVVSNSRVTNFSKQSEKIINTLSKMTVIIAQPRESYKQFIVASQPVVRFENFPKQLLGTEGVELWTTLTPRLAVGFVAPNAASSFISLPNQDVHKMNVSLTQQSSTISGPTKSLLETLGKRIWE